MLANVEKHGIEVESPDVVIGELAEASGLTPARLYDIALGQAGGSGGCADEHAGGGGGQRSGGSGGGSGRGFGQMTLRQYCVEAGLDVDTAVGKLKQQGFQAQADMTIRQIADSVGAHPSEIRGVIDAPHQ